MEKVDKLALQIHGVIFSDSDSSSDSDGKKDLDEEYEMYKPPPLNYNLIKNGTVKISAKPSPQVVNGREEELKLSNNETPAIKKKRKRKAKLVREIESLLVCNNNISDTIPLSDKTGITSNKVVNEKKSKAKKDSDNNNGSKELDTSKLNGSLEELPEKTLNKHRESLMFQTFLNDRTSKKEQKKVKRKKKGISENHVLNEVGARKQRNNNKEMQQILKVPHDVKYCLNPSDFRMCTKAESSSSSGLLKEIYKKGDKNLDTSEFNSNNFPNTYINKAQLSTKSKKKTKFVPFKPDDFENKKIEIPTVAVEKSDNYSVSLHNYPEYVDVEFVKQRNNLDWTNAFSLRKEVTSVLKSKEVTSIKATIISHEQPNQTNIKYKCKPPFKEENRASMNFQEYSRTDISKIEGKPGTQLNKSESTNNKMKKKFIPVAHLSRTWFYDSKDGMQYNNGTMQDQDDNSENKIHKYARSEISVSVDLSDSSSNQNGQNEFKESEKILTLSDVQTYDLNVCYGEPLKTEGSNLLNVCKDIGTEVNNDDVKLEKENTTSKQVNSQKSKKKAKKNRSKKKRKTINGEIIMDQKIPVTKEETGTKDEDRASGKFHKDSSTDIPKIDGKPIQLKKSVTTLTNCKIKETKCTPVVYSLTKCSDLKDGMQYNPGTMQDENQKTERNKIFVNLGDLGSNQNEQNEFKKSKKILSLSDLQSDVNVWHGELFKTPESKLLNVCKDLGTEVDDNVKLEKENTTIQVENQKSKKKAKKNKGKKKRKTIDGETIVTDMEKIPVMKVETDTKVNTIAEGSLPQDFGVLSTENGLKEMICKVPSVSFNYNQQDLQVYKNKQLVQRNENNTFNFGDWSQNWLLNTNKNNLDILDLRNFKYKQLYQDYAQTENICYKNGLIIRQSEKEIIRNTTGSQVNQKYSQLCTNNQLVCNNSSVSFDFGTGFKDFLQTIITNNNFDFVLDLSNFTYEQLHRAYIAFQEKTILYGNKFQIYQNKIYEISSIKKSKVSNSEGSLELSDCLKCLPNDVKTHYYEYTGRNFQHFIRFREIYFYMSFEQEPANIKIKNNTLNMFEDDVCSSYYRYLGKNFHHFMEFREMYLYQSLNKVGKKYKKRQNKIQTLTSTDKTDSSYENSCDTIFKDHNYILFLKLVHVFLTFVVLHIIKLFIFENFIYICILVIFYLFIKS